MVRLTNGLDVGDTNENESGMLPGLSHNSKDVYGQN
jgi:hypothetical protein